MHQINWLDRLAAHRLPEAVAKLKADSDRQFLTIELPRYETDVLYCEQGGAQPIAPGEHVFSIHLWPNARKRRTRQAMACPLIAVTFPSN